MGQESSGGHGSPGQRKSKRVHLPFGFRIKPRTLIYTVVLFVVMALFTVCAPLYFYWQDVEQTSAAREQSRLLFNETAEVPEPESNESFEVEEFAEEESRTLDSILALHREALGLDAVQSVLLRGTYLERGHEFEMKLAAKVPSLVRKVLADQQLELVCTYNGVEAKVEVSQGDVRETRRIEDAIYEHAILLEGAFLLLSEQAGEVRPQYTQAEDQVYQGNVCWTIESRIPDGPVMYHLIDSETGFERVRYMNLKIADTQHQLSLHLSDFREQASHHFPFAYTLKVNGAVHGRAELTSVKYNQGVMPWMF